MVGSDREGRVEARVARGSTEDPLRFRILQDLISQVLCPKP